MEGVDLRDLQKAFVFVRTAIDNRKQVAEAEIVSNQPVIRRLGLLARISCSNFFRGRGANDAVK